VKFPEVVGSPEQNDYSGQNRLSIRYFYDGEHPNDFARHAITKIKDAKDQVYVKNSYTRERDCDAFLFGRLISQTYGVGNFHYSYEEEPILSLPAGSGVPHLKVIENDRKGYVTEVYYNKQGNDLLLRHYTGKAESNFTTSGSNRPANKLRSSDPDYFDTRYRYTSFGLVSDVIFPEGNSVSYVYDSGFAGGQQLRRRQNKIVQESRVSKDGANTLVSSYEYETQFHQLRKATDARGYSTTYSYNGMGLLTRIDYPTVEAGASAPGETTQESFKTFAYNGKNQLREEVDEEGVVTEYAYYDPLFPSGPSSGAGGGYLESVTVDPSNLELKSSFAYDAVGNLLFSTDPNGNMYSYSVNALNQVTKTTSPTMSRFEADQGASYEVIKWYDPNGNVEKEWVELENSNNDEDANVPGFESPRHYETQYTYDKLDNVLTIKKEVIDDSETFPYVFVQYEYDKNENRIRTYYSEDEGAERDESKYDERDMLFKETIGELDTQPSTTRYDYTPNGKVHKVVAPGSQVTLSIYDGFDRLVEERNPVQTHVFYEYDENSNVTEMRVRGKQSSSSSSNILMSKIVNLYDEKNRKYRSTFVNRNLGTDINLETYSERVSYRRNNQIAKIFNRHGNRTLTTYDSANRVEEVKDPHNNTKKYFYDKNNNVTAMVSRERDLQTEELTGTYTILSRHDELNRLRETEDDFGYITYLNRDSRGLVALSTDAELHQKWVFYDGLGRDYSEFIDAQNGPIQLEKVYDKRSRVVRSIDGEGRVTRYEYDHHNRKTKKVLPNNTFQSYIHDRNDNLVQTIRENGDRIERVYDPANRPTQVLYKDSSGTTHLKDVFEYNGLNHLVKAETQISELGVNNGSKVWYQTDSRGLNLTCTQQIWNGQDGYYLPPRTFSAAYNAMGNMTSLQYPSGRFIRYEGYNKLEMATQIKTQGYNSEIAGRSDLVGYEYEGYGRVSKRTIKGDLERITTYDPIKRPTIVTEKRIGIPAVEFRHTFNGVHSKIAEEVIDVENSKHKVEIFEMDPYQRVIGHIKDLPPERKESALADFSSVSPSEGTDYERKVFDKAGNIENVTKATGEVVSYGFNNLNQVTSMPGKRTNIQYDGVGNLISYQEGDNLIEHVWNKRDQLIAYKKNGVFLEYYEYFPGSPIRSMKRSPAGDKETSYHFQDMICETYRIVRFGEVETVYPIQESVYESDDDPLVVFVGNGNTIPGEAPPASASFASSFATTASSSSNSEVGTFFYHANSRGNVYAVSNENGEVVRRYEYSLNGEVTELNASYQKDSELKTPSGSETLAVSGESYAFSVGVWNSSGSGEFTLELVSATENVNLSNAEVVLEPIQFVEENLHESEGVIEGLSGEGQITALLTYSESTGSISSTFIIRLTATTSTGDLAFLPRSSAKVSLGSAPLLIQASSSTGGGSYSLTAEVNETEGEFSEINASTGEFSFFGAVQSGLATAEVTYTLGTEAITALYVIEVEPRKAISRVSASFGGAIRDRTSGYLWMRSRYYDPVLGRFLSRDPAEDDSLSNDYTPFENNPANYRDPSGEIPLLALIPLAIKGAAYARALNYAFQYYSSEGFTTRQYNKQEANVATIGGALSGIIAGGLEEKLKGATQLKKVLLTATAFAADIAIGAAEEVSLSVWQQGSFAGVSWKGTGEAALKNGIVTSLFLAPSALRYVVRGKQANSLIPEANFSDEFAKSSTPNTLVENANRLELYANEMRSFVASQKGDLGRHYRRLRNGKFQGTIAVSELEIDNEVFRLPAFSGEKNITGFAEYIRNSGRNLEAGGALGGTGNVFIRDSDAEAKILEFVLNMTNSDTKAIFRLYSEREFCRSCAQMVENFHRYRTNLTLELYYGKGSSRFVKIVPPRSE
jgi:RHS repeat-associated protein